MRIDIITLFPESFNDIFNTSIIKRAISKNLVEINIINLRDYSHLKNKQVDDTIYGGGSGMLLMVEPIYNAIKALKKKDSIVILLSPEGETYNQRFAEAYAKEKHIILICGHYEGFDERVKNYVDQVISIGNYILTGGEIPAMAITDSVVRLIPGVINEESLESESFNDLFYDYPKYTKPQKFDGLSVPEVLINGDHEKINLWREENKKEIK